MIAELPVHVRNQIAAGEVIERPASVVKELVENALDAGAREVRVDLEEGGIALVRVVDDGVGMSRADLALAFTPHATSKLSTVSDLEHIASLGFRGEALASIGAVSNASILTRCTGEATGLLVENDWGSVGGIREAGGPLGTSVEVRELFRRLPARRRFLKRPTTELGRVLDVLQRVVLAHEGIGFRVTHDRRAVLDVEADMNRRERVRRIFGADLADALVDVSARDGNTELTGLVAPPRFGRRDTTRQMWFLNGRALRDKLLIRVLKQAYQGTSVEHRQPVAFLSLAMDPAAVDVNVHPTKSEVRFREDRRLFGFLHNALREAVLRTDMATPGERMIARSQGRSPGAPGVLHPHLPDPGPGLGVVPPATHRPDAGERPSVHEVPGRPYRPEPTDPAAGEPRPDASGAATPHEPGWAARDELAGPYLRVARTYVLRALADGFEIVDQHALHERVTFERLKAQVQRGGVEVQRLLVPELVELSRAEVERLEAHLEPLRAIGIHVERFGEATVAVHGVPALLRRVDAEELVQTLSALLDRRGAAPSAAELLEDVLHSRACRSSVMAGDELADEDVRALLEAAEALGGAQTCPHGRPTRVRFSLADLEKAFHRR